jgi:ureidoacrylate peracid hydrolase
MNGTVALLVIDMQNGFCSPEGSFARMGVNTEHFRAIVPEVADMRDAARANGLTVMYARQVFRQGYPEAGIQLRDVNPGLIPEEGLLGGGWDAEIVPELSPGPGEVVIDKRRYDAFLWTDLDLVLRRSGVSRLVVAGVSTNVCVESTVRSAAQHDYEVVVAADGVAASSPVLHDSALRSLAYAFATVQPWREIVDLK